MLANGVILAGIGLHPFGLGESERPLGIPTFLMVESIGSLRFELGYETLGLGKREELFR